MRLPVVLVLLCTIFIESTFAKFDFLSSQHKLDRKKGKEAFAEYSRSLKHTTHTLGRIDDQFTYRVVTFNVEQMKRSSDVLSTLSDINADVVVLQEILQTISKCWRH